METGPNDASGIVWAIGECFYLFPSNFLMLTNVLEHTIYVVIYRIRDREGSDVEKMGPNDASGIVWAK
jgi:hypothetical protein